MGPLQVETVDFVLSPEVLLALKEELGKGGVLAGALVVGSIKRVPTTLYFLWHLAGETPVTMSIRREAMTDCARARSAAQDFLLKWHQRLG